MTWLSDFMDLLLHPARRREERNARDRKTEVAFQRFVRSSIRCDGRRRDNRATAKWVDSLITEQ